MGEASIADLMSDEVSPYIRNSQPLMDKMLGYQEILSNALAII